MANSFKERRAELKRAEADRKAAKASAQEVARKLATQSRVAQQRKEHLA